MKKSPTFSNPPVIEVVLGVQFEPLGMTSGHLGWYWNECLGDEWPSTREAPTLPDTIEAFGGKQPSWPQLGLLFQTGATPNRLQIRHRNDDRMIQIQDTRFIYNWIKKGEAYPRYTTIRREFDWRFQRFREYVDKIKNRPSALCLNQWEVTYVNHIPSGALWQQPMDIANVFPVLLKRPKSFGDTIFETMRAEWRSKIPPQRGRLQISIHCQEVKQSDKSSNVLVAQLTTRGPVSDTQSWEEGLDLGHETIVSTFADISADSARKHWGEQVCPS